MTSETTFVVDEIAQTRLGERNVSLYSAGRDPTALMRLQVDDVRLEMPRQDWTYVYRMLGALLAPLPELPEPRRVRTGPARRGKPWVEDEDDRLMSAWLGGATLEDLAEEHERTQGAVAARLVKHGLVDDAEQARAQSKSGERRSAIAEEPQPAPP